MIEELWNEIQAYLHGRKPEAQGEWLLMNHARVSRVLMQVRGRGREREGEEFAKYFLRIILVAHMHSQKLLLRDSRTTCTMYMYIVHVYTLYVYTCTMYMYIHMFM